MNNNEVYIIFEKILALKNIKMSSCLPLPQAGSMRHYFRIFTDTQTLIGTYSTSIEENEAFFSMTNFFHDAGLPVPEIIAINDERNIYVQTDLGENSLYSFVTKDLKETSTISLSTLSYYQKAVAHLVDFQLAGQNDFDFSKCYPTQVFDRSSILDDLDYFRYYFLKPMSAILFNEMRLRQEFAHLADFIDEAPKDFFMYRDFQSRNIIVNNDNLYFIDYQGGRKGPLQYDLVSLLYQVKAQLSDENRAFLKEYYLKKLSERVDIQQLNFEKYYNAFVLSRLTQVLGAYGFRGLIQKKQHFVESIVYAIRELVHFNATQVFPIEMPEFRSVIKQMEHLLSRFDTHSEKLVVEVSSFSFRNGGAPTDLTGNGGGFVFDCRALPNPGRLPEFRLKTGLDPEVISWLEEKPEVPQFLEHVVGLVAPTIDNYLDRKFNHLSIDFGCTGGQHRSVYFAQKTALILHQRYPQIIVKVVHSAQNQSIIYGQ